MKIKYYKLLLLALPLLFISCSDDDDENNVVIAPNTYEFTRDGASTVSFSGQTARLNMADEIYAALNTNTSSSAKLLEMHNDGTGFSDATLDASGKKIGSKTAAGCSHGVLAATQQRFKDMLSDYDDVKANWNATAANGKAGLITDANRTINVNANGWELDQTYIKGIIGGMCVDQIVNNYLDPCQLDSGTRRADNDNGVLASGKNYTDMEHKWDEAFGYMYGQEADPKRADLGTNPVKTGTTLYKYLYSVNGQAAHAGISSTIFDAFKLGRAAIVAKNYEVRDEQIKILAVEISKIVGQKAVNYLEGYVSTDKAVSPADAIHDLSEGYGFILSLMFTNDGTGSPYFSEAEVNTMLSKLSNFWTVSDSELTQMANDIKGRFNF